MNDAKIQKKAAKLAKQFAQTIGMVIDVSATGVTDISKEDKRVVKALCMHYFLPANAKILDIGERIFAS